MAVLPACNLVSRKEVAIQPPKVPGEVRVILKEHGFLEGRPCLSSQPLPEARALQQEVTQKQLRYSVDTPETAEATTPRKLKPFRVKAAKQTGSRCDTKWAVSVT